MDARDRVATGFLLSGAVTRAVAEAPQGTAAAADADARQLEALRCLLRTANLLGIPAHSVGAIGRVALSHIADERAAAQVRALVRCADPDAMPAAGPARRPSRVGTLLCRSLVREAGRVERSARDLRPATGAERRTTVGRLAADASRLDRVLRECAHVLSASEGADARAAIAAAQHAARLSTPEAAADGVARACERLALGVEGSPALAPGAVDLADHALRRAQAVIRRCRRVLEALRETRADPAALGATVGLADRLEETAAELADVRVMVRLALETYAFARNELRVIESAYPDVRGRDLPGGRVLYQRLDDAEETVGRLRTIDRQAVGLAAEVEPARTALRTARFLLRRAPAAGGGGAPSGAPRSNGARAPRNRGRASKRPPR